MVGNEEKVIQRSKRKHGAIGRNSTKEFASSQYSVNTVYMLLKEILSKTENP